MRRKDTLNVQVSGSVYKSVLSHVNENSKVSEEVCTENGFLDICNDEDP